MTIDGIVIHRNTEDFKKKTFSRFDVFVPTHTKDEINGLSHDETVKWKLTGWMLRKSASTLRMYSCSHLLRP